ncbi:nucleic acid binding protein [gamma proteobacterium BDW918]|uniref:GntR family transcriptional regulator n=1 Tax=Zhongshania aliphaticivorans TaxID=1470434 RepID=A0A127M469_9GAMM|nr:S1-like domain-containing RNA-binding protein [Zhongshania aliphaticivorans]AMO68028.1 GntR family transcriptional regulator [Zhongshania aliphaticivorans]EIF44477.1 nucleic acid binding protein [gamma proteobacterium BDW918]
MPDIGRVNRLTVSRQSPAGFYLDGGDLGDIFLSRKNAPENCQIGDIVDGFIHHHSDGSLIASSKTPLAQLGDVALLKIAQINDTGAFLDWGLDKELLLPYAEHMGEITAGKKALVKIYLDKSYRIVASMKLDEFIEDTAPHLSRGQRFDVIVAGKTELGYKAVIDNGYWGLLYDSDLIRPLRKGETLTAYVKKVRDDGRIDLSIQPINIGGNDIAAKIIAQLEANDGFLAVGDKSPPEAIYSLFGVSKKIFKQAIGRLYKQKRIDIEGQGIRLLKP